MRTGIWICIQSEAIGITKRCQPSRLLTTISPAWSISILSTRDKYVGNLISYHHRNKSYLTIIVIVIIIINWLTANVPISHSSWAKYNQNISNIYHHVYFTSCEKLQGLFCVINGWTDWLIFDWVGNRNDLLLNEY